MHETLQESEVIFIKIMYYIRYFLKHLKVALLLLNKKLKEYCLKSLQIKCLLQGQYYQVGDVVSILDQDGSIYYAQLRGFLQDQYMEKSAVITWLLPTMASPETGFDPATFILGLYA